MRVPALLAAAVALAAPAVAQPSVPDPLRGPPADPAAHYWLGAGFAAQCGSAAVAPACDPFLVGLVSAQDAESVRTGVLPGCPFLRAPLAEIRTELRGFVVLGGETHAAMPVAEIFQRMLRVRPALCRLGPPATP